MSSRQPMKTASVADAKSHFSALLAEAEIGREVIITRRGKAVARLVPEPKLQPAAAVVSDWSALRRWVSDGAVLSGPTVAEMRERDSL